MTTQCTPSYLDFPMVGPREVLADFDGGDITSDGGGLLLRKTEEVTGIIRQFAACFTDHRDPDLVEHPSRTGRPAGLRPGPGLRGPQRPRRPAARSAAGHPRRQGRSHRQDTATPSRPRQGAGRQEHPQSPRTDPRRRRPGQPLQEDHLQHPRRSNACFVTLFLQAHRTPPRADRPGPGRHRRSRCTAINSAASSTATTRATAICRCTSSAAITCSAPGCGRPTSTPCRGGQATAADRGADPRGLAAGADLDPRRQRVLPRGDPALVRGQRRGLRVRPGEEHAAGRGDRRASRSRPGSGSRRRGSRRASSRSSAIAR